MRHHGGSAFPLLVIIVLLVLSLVMLHNNKKSFFSSYARNQAYTISSDLKNHLTELMDLESYDKIAQLVDRFHFVKRVQLVRLLLYDSAIRSSDEQKLQAFFKILTLSVRKDYQKALLNEFDLKKFQFKKPFLGLVVTHASSLLPLILQWLSSHYEPEFLVKFGSQAYQFAVATNDSSCCALLLQYHVAIDKHQANQLLLDVIHHDKNKAFIPMLVRLGADLQKNIVSKKLLLYGLQKQNLVSMHSLW